MNLIDQIEIEQLRTDIPDFSAGDTVVVQVKVREEIVRDCKPLKVL